MLALGNLFRRSERRTSAPCFDTLESKLHAKILDLDCNLGEVLTGYPHGSLQSQPADRMKVEEGTSVTTVVM